VREVVLRSLAVNHPVTFLRALCFSLQLTEYSPKLKLPHYGLALAETGCILTAAGTALNERRDLLVEAMEESELDEESGPECAPLCAAVMQHVCQVLSKKAPEKPEDLHAMSWRFLDRLCLFTARASPQPVIELCLPATAGCLEQVGRADVVTAPMEQSAVACCMCLQTVVGQLGKAVLASLNVVVRPLLALIAANAKISGTVLLEQTALETMQVIVRDIGSFMSPYLEALLGTITAPAASWRNRLLESLGHEIVAVMPHRLLFPALQSAVAVPNQHLASIKDSKGSAHEINSCLVALQRLAALHMWMFSAAVPEFVSVDADAMANTFVKLLAGGPASISAFLTSGGQLNDIPEAVLRRTLLHKPESSSSLTWAENCVDGGVQALNLLVAGAFAQFALRLQVEELKPRFVTILDWTRNSQPRILERQGSRKSDDVDVAADCQDASRALGFVAVVLGLTREAPEVAEVLILPLATQDLASCLTASRRQAMRLASTVRKRRRSCSAADASAASAKASEALAGQTWWWFDVSSATLNFISLALRNIGESENTGKAAEDAVEALLEPITDLLDLFAFLKPSDVCSLSSSFLIAVQGAVVGLTAASHGPLVKRILTAILEKGRKDAAEVRLSAVRVCHKVWMDLGAQVVTALSEVVIFAAELLEDEDARVEAAVRAMVNTMEECTGESLQESLKR